MNSVIVRGVGVVAPGGIGKENFWERISSGRSAVDRIKAFDPSPHRTQIAAECSLPHKSNWDFDRCFDLMIPAIDEAILDSNISKLELNDAAVVVGNAVGATVSMEKAYKELSDSGKYWNVKQPEDFSKTRKAFVPSSFSYYVAKKIGSKGPAFNISNGCTSGIDALGYGVSLVKNGVTDRAVVVAVDAPISPITLACFDAIRATNAQITNVKNASRPFDKTRSGLVLGEGAACVIIEKENIENQDKTVNKKYCYVTGFANRMNAFHMTGLRSDGHEMAIAIEKAINQAGISVDEIDYINAHGSSTKQNDLHETNAFKKIFGKNIKNIPISSIKGVIGHSLGAIGLIEIIASIIAIEKQCVPPTANLENYDDELGLDYVPLKSRKHKVNNVLKVGSGFGGFQSAIVLSKENSLNVSNKN